MISSLIGSVIMSAVTVAMLIALNVINKGLTNVGKYPLNEEEILLLKSAKYTSSLDIQNKDGNALPDAIEEKDIETFYTFKWINKQIKNKRANRDKQTKPKDGETGKSKYKRKANKKQRVKSDQPKSFEANPEKSKKIDPDNPFAAALMDFSKKN